MTTPTIPLLLPVEMIIIEDERELTLPSKRTYHLRMGVCIGVSTDDSIGSTGTDIRIQVIQTAT